MEFQDLKMIGIGHEAHAVPNMIIHSAHTTLDDANLALNFVRLYTVDISGDSMI